MADAIGAVIIDVKSDISYLVTGMKKAEGVIESSSQAMIGAAKLIAVAYSAISFKNLIDESSQLANEVGKVSEKYAIGVEELTKWHYIVNSAGVKNDQFNDSLKDMSKNITDFQRDGSGATKAFKSLGITQEFAKKSMTNTSESMKILLQKLDEMPNGMERTTIAMELFGEEGANMVRVADMGAKSIATLTDEALKGNIAVSNSYYQKAEAYQNAQHRLDELQSGFADAVIEESQFLEAGTTMYQMLGDAQLAWTQSVQSGNNIFINGLNELSTGAVAVLPEAMVMFENLGNAVVTTGTAVIELVDIAFSPLLEVLDYFFGATDENITGLGVFSAYIMGTTMAIENFATLLRLGVSELEVFAIYIETKVMANLHSMSGSLLSASAKVAEFTNMVSFGEFGENYKELALEAERYEIQSKKVSLQGEIEVAVLREKQMALIGNIHTINDIDKAMARTATNVSKRQKEGINSEVKKQEAYKHTALVGMNALGKIENKHDLATKASQAHAKVITGEARALDLLQQKLDGFENTYKKSTMSDFSYRLEQLEKEKKEYIDIGAERLKVEKWYSVELAKLEKERNDKWSKIEDEKSRKLEEQQSKKLEAYKEYLRIIGDFDKITKLENSKKLIDLKPLLDSKQYAEVKNKFDNSSELTSFADGIADAFGIDKNKNLKDNISDIKYELGNVASNLFSDLLNDIHETGSVSQSVQNLTDSNALGNSMMSSGNPYLAGAAIAGQFLGDAMSEPMDAFQSMEADIHQDNTAIKDSMSIIESVAFPQLEIAKKSRQHLQNIENSFSSIGKSLSFRDGSFSTGAGFEGSMSYNANQSAIAIDAIDPLSDFTRALANSIFGHTETTLKDSGITAESQTARNFANNLSAEQYQIIEEESSYIFGLIKSTSYDTATQALDDSTAKEFSRAYGEGIDQILQAGISLGVDGLKLSEQLGNHLTEEMKLSLKDASDEEIAKKIRGWFGNEFNTMVEESLPFIEEFKRVGEDSFTSLTRVSLGYEEAVHRLAGLNIEAVDIGDIVDKNKDVATEAIRDSILNVEGRKFETVAIDVPNIASDSAIIFGDFFGSIKSELINGITSMMPETTEIMSDAELTGIGEIIKSFNGSAGELATMYTDLDNFQFQLRSIGMSVTEVTQDMINGAGDLATLKSGQSSFIKNYFTEQEQSEIAISALNREFEQLNITMPKSKEEFRSYLESITDSEKYGEMVALADDYYRVDELRNSAQKEAIKLIEEEADAREKSNKKYQDFIDSMDFSALDYRNIKQQQELAQGNYFENGTIENAQRYLETSKKTATNKYEYGLKYNTVKNDFKEKIVSPKFASDGSMVTSSPILEKKYDDLEKKVDELNTSTKTASKEEVEELKSVVKSLGDLIQGIRDNAQSTADAIQNSSYQQSIGA